MIVQTTNWKRNLILLMLGQSLTIFASVLAGFAILWYVTLMTGSGLAMTLLTLAKFVPQFLVSPFAGVWADRYNKKWVLCISDSFVAIMTLIVAIIFSIGHEYIFLLLICNVARGIGHGILAPTFSSVIPEVVPKEQLMRINGISQSIQSISQMAAPAVAGALMAFLPISTILYFDVATALIGIFILIFFVKVPKRKILKGVSSTWHELSLGLTYIKKNQIVKWLIIIAATMNFMVGPIVLLVPLQTIRLFGEEAWRLAVVELAFFGGMAFGGVVISVFGGFKNKMKTIFFATILCGVMMGLMGFLNDFTAFIVVRGLAGVFVSMARPPMITIIQLQVESKLHGRVFAIMSMLTTAVLPLGMLIWGPLADVVNINLIFKLCGLGIVLIGVWFIVFYIAKLKKL